MHSTADLSRASLYENRQCDIRISFRAQHMDSAFRLQIGVKDIAWFEMALPQNATKVHVDPNAEPIDLQEAKGDSLPSTGAGTSLSFIAAEPIPTQVKSTDVADSLHQNEDIPVYAISLKNVAVEDIHDSIIQPASEVAKYVEQNLKGIDVTATPWASSRRIPGAQTSQMKWKMPVPSDLPAEVSRLRKQD